MKKFDYERQTWGGGEIDLNKKTFASLRLQILLKHLKNFDFNSKKILEIGCGQGRYIKAIKKIFPLANCYGIDISQKAIELANLRPYGVTFESFDGANINFAGNNFDLVMVFDVLEHVQDDNNFLFEISRVLKPNGLLHLNVPLENDIFSIWKYLRLLKLDPALKWRYAGHIQNYDSKNFKKLLEKYFDVSRQEYSFHMLGQLLDAGLFYYMHIAEKLFKKLINSNQIILKTSKLSPQQLAENIAYLETKLLKNFPGMSIHLTGKKKL